jgi:fatty acid desaturase
MSTNKRLENLSPHLSGVVLFWMSCLCVLLGFWVDNVIMSVFLLSFCIPVFYGTHEAVHETLIPRRGLLSFRRGAHNTVALMIGSALQGINFRLLRPAHLYHHRFGRYDDGFAPDIVTGKPSLRDYIAYYLYLCGFPAFQWQIAGFVCLFAPLDVLPFSHEINFKQEKSRVPFWVSQLTVIAFFGYAIYFGGWLKFALFGLIFCFLWSVLQNVAHYGLKGFDATTDRVCAYTYLLEWPFKYATFGSTSHLAHHVDMQIPGLYLYEPEILAEIENRIEAEIVVKRGVAAFLRDVLYQFRGPLMEEELTLEWMSKAKALDKSKRVPHSFGYRSGRSWGSNSSPSSADDAV